MKIARILFFLTFIVHHFVFSQFGNIPSYRLTTTLWGTYGNYSYGRSSTAGSVYATLIKGVHSSYTFGADVLQLSQKDQGGNFFSQELISGRGSWWLGGKWSLTAHTAVLNEDSYSFQYTFNNIPYTAPHPSAQFYFLGGGALFHQSQQSTAILTGTISFFDKSVFSQLATLKYSTELSRGLTCIAGIDAGKTNEVLPERSTPLLFSGRGQVTWFLDPVFLNAKVMAGRRVFFFDESLLVLFNQREQQTASYGGGIAWFASPSFSVTGTFEYEKFDGYSIAYTALGVKYNFVSH